MERNRKVTEDEESLQRTAFGKAVYNMTHSERVMDDLTFGRRVGFYELKGEIGSGNFSQVRLGIHDLTKGEILDALILIQHTESFTFMENNMCTTKIQYFLFSFQCKYLNILNKTQLTYK